MSDPIEAALRSSSIFKDESTLFSAYIPPEVKYREQTQAAIARNFRPLFSADQPGSKQLGGWAVNLAIIGAAGVGKTTTARFTVDRLEKMAKSEGMTIYTSYSNCWTTRTRTAVLRGILREQFGIQTRGFSDEEAMDILVRRLTSERAHLIQILDEISVLSPEDVRTFLHLPEEYGGMHHISIIMISRPTEWNTSLAPIVAQRITDVIQIPPYTKSETEDILNYRAQLALRPSAYTPEIIEMIAEITCETLNMRHGIEILLRAGKNADMENIDEISPEHVRTAKASVYPELRSSVLESLQKHELLAALGIARRLKHKNVTATSVNDAYSNYEVACEEWGEKPLSMSSFRKFIDVLESLGIIGMLVSHIGRGKRGRRAKLTIHDVPALVLIERIESILSQENWK